MRTRSQAAASDQGPSSKTGLIGGVWTLTGGRAVAHASTLVVMPLLTRLYTPESYGAFGVFVAILSIASVPACLRFELAILEPRDDREAAHLTMLSIAAAGLVGIIVAVAAWSLEGAWLPQPAFPGWPLLIAASVVAVGVYQALVSWALRWRDYRAVARAQVLQSLTRAGSQVGLGLLGAGQIGLIAGEWLAQSVRSAALAGRILGQGTWVFRPPGGREMWRIARAHWRYPAFSLPAGFLNAAALSVPSIALAAMYGTEVAGWFVFGKGVLEVPMILIGTSVGQAYLGEVTRSRRQEPASVARVFRRTAGGLAILGTGVMIVGLSAPWWFPPVFGAAWREAGIYSAMLSGGAALALTASPTSCLSPLGFNHWQLGWAAAYAGIVAAVLGGAWWAALPPRGAVLLLTLAMAAGYSSLLWVNHAAVWRIARRAPERPGQGGHDLMGAAGRSRIPGLLSGPPPSPGEADRGLFAAPGGEGC